MLERLELVLELRGLELDETPLEDVRVHGSLSVGPPVPFTLSCLKFGALCTRSILVAIVN